MKRKSHIKHEMLSAFKNPKSNDVYLNDFSISNIDLQRISLEDYSLFDESVQSDFFVVLFIDHGHINLRVNQKDVLGIQDQLLFFLPGHFKQVISCESDSRLILITFTADFFKDLSATVNLVEVMEYYLSKPAESWILDKEERLVFMDNLAELNKRVAKMSSHLFGKEILGNVFLTFLYDIANFNSRSQAVSSLEFGRKEDLVLKFLKLVDQECLSERRVDYYADKLFVTAKYLSETVKEVTGKTAGVVIDEANIAEAKRVLADPYQSISKIAYNLNYSSPSFFSKFFKRMTGNSPQEYRRTIGSKS
ncbi:helix-turn-helix domain-containing protein [Sphingobacterium bambusae]|uniref:Helix-turn-helix domain-containing protein n=1 Tax=Sphingobacterium bambusae TaxID=662858 RepID=A0ABW6BJP8_9SPHI|nr:helix-turn-helix domain-containing protein [Sphingobacterium bambusae]WPL49443.1 helix-turn-helix domain-containing protein [Sphingobacterium bambusae]